ncbi:MAG: pilus assembly protein PilM [Deltaproteobacteria bacterium]|nr:pilus assembly protein PilM [Deltaproteobacteria bacterium]
MAQKILGIDIGSYSVKIAEIERAYKGFELVNFYERVVAYNEVLSPEEAIAATLQKLVDDFSLKPDIVLASLPGSLVATRLLELPFSNPKKIDTTVEFEMEGYLPFSLEDLLIDYHILKSAKNLSSILVAYGKKTDFVKFLSIFKDLEFEPRFIGCEPVELGNLLKLGLAQPEGAYAIINIGHLKTEVSLFVGPTLRYTRTVMTGGKAMTEEIAKTLSVPYEEAEKIKIELGQLSENMEGLDAMGQKVGGAIRKVMEGLLVELKQTFLAFEEMGGETVQALYLCGGTSRLPGIDQFLSFRIRKNVSFLDPLDFPFNRLSDSNWCRPLVSTALSYALRAVFPSGGFPDVQFRRGEFAYRGDVEDLSKVVKQTGFLLAGLILFALVNFLLSYSLLQSRVSGVRKEVSKLVTEKLPDTPKKMVERPQSAISVLNGKIQEVRDKKRRLEEETSLSVLKLLKEISTVIPEKANLVVDMDNLNIVSNKIRLQGRTNSFESVDKLKESLSRSPLFKNVTTGNVKKGVKDEIKFDLSLEVRVGEEGGDHGT